MRARALAVALLVAVLAGTASGAPQAPARSAKEFLTAARVHDARALVRLRHSGGAAAAPLLRASHAELAGALDTLGAAELDATTTGAIRTELVAAARLGAQVLATPNGPTSRLAGLVQAALGHEAKAAALLGNAPTAPAISELLIPVSLFGAFDAALAPDGRSVWVSGSDGSILVVYHSLEPGATPTVVELPSGSGPRGITFGPDGSLYVAETGTTFGGNAIGRLLPTGEYHEFFLPAGAGGPWGIAVADGKIWFTEVTSGKIGRFDPMSGQFVEYPLPTPNSQPQGIVRGADGALWGTEAAGNRIFRITTAGRATEFPIPTKNSVPVAIAVGRYGYLWASELSGGKLARISRTGKIREFPLPRGARPYGLVSAPDGNIWFADRGRNRIGLVTPAGRVFEFPIATPNAQPTAIVPLAPGAFAFTEFVANRVGTLRFGRPR